MIREWVMGVMGVLGRLHGRPVPGVPRWVRWSAYATTLVVLPSCLWRLAGFLLDVPLIQRDPSVINDPTNGPTYLGGPGYIIGLSVLSEALAFLTVGLVTTWGETFPRWIPFLGRRPVPVLGAVIPAGIGAVVLTLLGVWVCITSVLGLKVNLTPAHSLFDGWQQVVFDVCYIPLVAWGPLLGIVTIAYYRRRRRQPVAQELARV